MIYYYKEKLPEDCVALPLNSPAFRYGVGFFETLFYNGKAICHLDRHLQRIFAGLSTYQIGYERIDFEQIILKVIAANNLIDTTARINIYYYLEDENAAASPLIAAYPYQPQPEKIYRLQITKVQHQSHLNRHKTMNFMHYYLAGLQAKRNGYDDALLVDAEGRILETSRAAIILGKNNIFFTPKSDNILPSSALDIAALNIEIAKREIQIDELSDFEHVYLLNALIGMKPVISLDRQFYATDEKTCERISTLILNPS